MARSRVKVGGPTRGRLRVLKMGMGSGKILAKGRVKKPKRGKGPQLVMPANSAPTARGRTRRRRCP
jgi:hypothetical protein